MDIHSKTNSADPRRADAFRRSLDRWFRCQGRSLPWRSTRDPYAVMVSEFMLQQTTVAAVVPFFERWMKQFPDVQALAAADEQSVLKLWEGLGYYSRARNLHRAARAIVAQDGIIPRSVSALRELPGIGPYTAAAIAAFAFDECVPVLDANIIRVVARLFDFRNPVNTAEGRIFLERAARVLLPRRGGCAHASALMDLGATVCRAGQPDCAACPVQKFCSATDPGTIPRKPARAQTIAETDCRIFAERADGVCLVPSDGPRWRGLWLLPPGPPSDAPIHISNYVVTRHRIRLEVARARALKAWRAFAADALPPMPSPHRRALEQILSGRSNRKRPPQKNSEPA